MKEKLRLMISVIIGGGPGVIGDVNIARLPVWFLYGYYALVMAWLHMPKIVFRKTFDDLKKLEEDNKYLRNWQSEDHQRRRKLESVIDQLDHKLRETDQLNLLREAQKNVEDPDWDYPKHYYKTDEDKKWTTIISHPRVGK